MKRWQTCVVIITLTVLGITTSRLKAQDQAFKPQLLEKLYTKLVQSPIAGTNTVAAGHSILILANPGVALDPALHPETSQSDRRSLSRVLDHLPGPSFVYQEMPYALSRVYSDVLQYHDVPVVTMSEQQKRDLKTANRTLFRDGNPAKGDSSKVAAYKKYGSIYEDRVNATESHRAHDGSVPDQFVNAQQSALQDWEKVGFKNEVDLARVARNNLTSLDPQLWFQDLFGAYTAAQESPGTPDQFEPIGLLPSYSSWPNLSGWTKITLSGTEIASLQPTGELHIFRPLDQAKIVHSADVDFGPFHFGGSSTTTNNQTNSTPEEPISNISMEVLRVSLDRPWLDYLVFRSKLWRWSHSSPLASSLISDGATPPGSITADILMPYVPTAVLVSRNVRIESKRLTANAQTLTQHINSGTEIRIGPFVIGGSYQQDVTKEKAKAMVSADAIAIPGYQIIGWYCEALPKSPDPDLQNYKWPGVTP